MRGREQVVSVLIARCEYMAIAYEQYGGGIKYHSKKKFKIVPATQRMTCAFKFAGTGKV